MNEITNELMKYLLPLALGVATAVGGVFIAYLNKKKAQIIASTDNVVAKKYIDMVGDTVIDCVEAINQTYVDALKKDNAFTKKAQEVAFKQCYDKVLSLLSQDAIEYIDVTFGDIETYLEAKIESTVKAVK